MKLQTWLPLLILVLPVYTFAQYFSIDTIKENSPYSRKALYIFPHLSSRENPSAANAINKIMRDDLLNLDSDTYKKSIFENVWGNDTDNFLPMLSDISFEEINNSKEFFCLSISATGCGAYCQDRTQYYVCDSKTGNSIYFSSLFTKTGIKSITDSIKTIITKRIQKQVKNLKATINSPETTPDNKEGINTALEVYEDCIDAKKTNDYNEVSYYLNNSKLTINLDPCLPHAIRLFDEVDYNITFKPAQIKNFLSPYAKRLLKL